MAATQAVVARYALDPVISSLQVRVFATGLLAGFGHNPTFAARDFSGEIIVPPNGPAEASLTFKVRATSLAVPTDIKDKDRRDMERIMNEQVLETARFPEIVFRSTAVHADQTGSGQYQVTLDGELSVRGVTASQQVVAYCTLGEEQTKAWGEFNLLQSRFGISPVSFAGGALKLKDELKLSFDIVARRERE